MYWTLCTSNSFTSPVLFWYYFTWILYQDLPHYKKFSSSSVKFSKSINISLKRWITTSKIWKRHQQRTKLVHCDNKNSPNAINDWHSNFEMMSHSKRLEQYISYINVPRLKIPQLTRKIYFPSTPTEVLYFQIFRTKVEILHLGNIYILPTRKI